MKRKLPSLALLLCACGGGVDSHNLGDTADAPLSSPVATSVDDFSGSWIGEAEDPLGPWQNGAPRRFQFPSGSTQIRLDIDATGGVLNASLTLGMGDPPPWPAVLSEGYPPTVDYTVPALWDSLLPPPIEGYAYALSGEYAPPGRPYVVPAPPPDGLMELSFNPLQWLSPWCDLQISSESALGYYSCAGTNPGYNLAPGQILGTAPASCHDGDQPLDCNKYYLCMGSASAVAEPSSPACVCSLDHCGIDDTPQIDLFLSREGDDLVGIFSNGLFARAGGTLAALGQVRLHHR